MGSAVSRRAWFVGALLGVLLLAGCGGTSGAFDRANVVCGPRKPVRIIQHVHEFTSDNWLEVRCSDGTTRAVHGG